MSFEVTEEPLDRVRGAAVSLLNATRRDPIDESRFDWMYRSNPDGPAVLWSVRETGSADLAGFTVALPRRMIVDGELRSAWNCADFSMDPRYRTLGPAIKLRRAYSCHYDFNLLDENAILGRPPGLENFYLASGFSGHGLQQSPAVGRALSELITFGAYRTLDLSRLDYQRVLTGKAVVETNCY